mmetsp:Transcript_25528/g.42014  ORF Transcript_25528/g.42014 Transcript_25528/m.42014 type:complete len:563 (+) Transcript_25528:86-1774(+)
MVGEGDEDEEVIKSASGSSGKVRWPVVYAILFAILFGLAGFSCSGKDSCPELKDFLSCFVIDGTGFEKCKFFGGPGKGVETKKKDDTPKAEDLIQWEDTIEGRKEYFSTIWNTKKWGSGKPGEAPRSGPGSTFHVTANIRKSLKKFLQEQEIFDMVDVGCGDLTWMPAVLREVKTNYLGLDIVDGIIDYDKPRFERNVSMQFGTIDVVEKSPPLRDLVFLREVLSHTLADSALKALKKITASGSKWLIMTTFPNAKSNPETKGYKLTTKSYFHWNFEIAPFNLGKPITYLNDSWDQSPMGLWRMPLWDRKSSDAELLRLEDTTEGRKKLFDIIWKENHWGDKGQMQAPRSGQGSTLHTTENVRKGLVDFIKQYNIKSMVDLPCGDMTWMPEVLQKVHLDSYVGLDIVEEMIKENQDRFKSMSFMNFGTIDASVEPIPKADLIFCREMFQHMLRDTARKTLENFRRSGAKWLMATTFVITKDNWDTTAMNKKLDVFIYWPWNLQLDPFNMGTPTLLVDDYHPGMSMGIWRMNKDDASEVPPPPPPAVSDSKETEEGDEDDDED